MRVMITDREELLRLEAEYKRLFWVEADWTGYNDPVKTLREAIESGVPVPAEYDPFIVW